MIAASRDVFVANAERDAVGLIRMEIETIQAYFSTLGTQSALLGGFAFSLISSDPDTSWDQEGAFFFLACISCSLLMITVVYSSVVGSHASTMGLTGAQPSEVRHTVVLMRRDQWYIEFSFYLGIITFMASLCLRVLGHSNLSDIWKIACSLTIGLVGCLGSLISATRGYQRYRSHFANHAVVSGDEFLNINHHNRMHAAAAAAVEKASRPPDGGSKGGFKSAVQGTMSAVMGTIESLSGLDIDGDGEVAGPNISKGLNSAGRAARGLARSATGVLELPDPVGAVRRGSVSTLNSAGRAARGFARAATVEVPDQTWAIRQGCVSTCSANPANGVGVGDADSSIDSPVTR